MVTSDFKAQLEQIVSDVGFSSVGITNPTKIDTLIKERFVNFIKNDWHAGMCWLEKRIDQRVAPQKLWPSVKSVLVFTDDYPILEGKEEEICYITERAKKKRKKRRKSKTKKKSTTPSRNLYKGKKVDLNKPRRGGKKKFYVYVRNPKTDKIIKVEWGAKGMSVGINDPARRKSFAARHRCSTHANDKTKPRYWACRTGRYPHLTGSKKKYTWW